MVVAALLAAAPATPAAAQNVFEALFGGLRRPVPQPQISGPSDLFRSIFQDDRRERHGQVRSGGIGPRMTYCVRLCDGRYFPLQPQRNVSATAQCNAFCPASETRIFSGSGIEHAAAANGRRYTDLPNAYVYRKRLVAGCTCSGRSTTGVAAVAVDDDTTLRPGDIVAGNSGFTVYRGKDRQQQSQFTPIELANVSQRVREQLADVKIVPSLPSATAAAIDPAKSAPRPAGQAQALASPDTLLLSARAQ